MSVQRAYSQPMRQSYQTQLSDLSEIGARMCDLAVEAMRGATTALLDADLALAERVIAMDVTLDEMRAEAEEGAVSAAGPPGARWPPTCGPSCRRCGSSPTGSGWVRWPSTSPRQPAAVTRCRCIPDSVRPIFAEMGRVAVDLGTEAAAVLRDRDPERARAIDAKDAVMDALHGQLFTALLSPEWTHGVPPAVDISLLGRFYERFADHAVSVGRRVVFLLTGENVGGDTTVAADPARTADPSVPSLTLVLFGLPGPRSSSLRLMRGLRILGFDAPRMFRADPWTSPDQPKRPEM